ncbi:MAG TPA: DUF4330 family protein [Vicinamibacterales bacterium]|nr:DUF4330 family protein [Vicinamibacterales bacterium]
MSVVDKDGRLFGRVNLVDAGILIFILLLIPIGYATFLLFRPERPSIESVTRVEIGNEERRVSGGTILTAKLKVRGTGFNPLLRARIDSIEAVGLVFENPNSVDVIVGLVPPGKHDLVLYDGVQEVARAPGAVEIQATDGPSVRAYGWFTDLEPGFAQSLKAGYATDPTIPGAFRIVALGPVRPGRVRATLGGTAADLPLAGKSERAAEVVVRCDWPSTVSCTIDGQRLTQIPPMIVALPGGLRFEIDEVAPADDPTPATVLLRVASAGRLKVGDRDGGVGDRAAKITAIAGNVVTLALGVHDSREGWRYRGELVTPGSTFTLRTETYTVSGTVDELRVEHK